MMYCRGGTTAGLSQGFGSEGRLREYQSTTVTLRCRKKYWFFKRKTQKVSIKLKTAVLFIIFFKVTFHWSDRSTFYWNNFCSGKPDNWKNDQGDISSTEIFFLFFNKIIFNETAWTLVGLALEMMPSIAPKKLGTISRVTSCYHLFVK